MPVIVDSDPVVSGAVAAHLPAGTHTVSDLDQLDNWLIRQHDEYVILLGPSIDLEAATALAQRLRLSRPATSVILVRPEVSTVVLARAMQSGIREVVGQSDPAAMVDAVDRAHQTWAAIHGPGGMEEPGEGKVITIFSPKGGVGKTTIAVNLALALADHGSRRVCVVDLDLAFGDVAITLQLIPEHTISEAVEVEAHLDFDMLQKLLTRHQESLMVLAAPTHPGAKDRIPASLVRRVIATLRHSFDYIVIDTSPSFDEQVLQAFDETDECVLVATLDVPTVKNVKMAIETLDLLHIALGHRWLVVNRADDEVGLTTASVETILGMPVAAAMPSSMEVANATNHGRPIVLSRPDHPVSRSIRTLATALDRQQPVPARGPKEHISARRGLFKRK